MKYNVWNAIAYEVTNILIEFDPRWLNNWWIQLLRKNCIPDWVEWKTEQTLKKVDKQIESLQKSWKEEDDRLYVKPVVREYAPDGSKAQDLLGGTIQISAPWYKPTTSDTTRTTPAQQESNHGDE